MKKDILQMTVAELLEDKADIEIHFNNGFIDKEEARDVIEEYTSDYIETDHKKVNWFTAILANNSVVVRSYYTHDESDKTEEARASLTEYERKMKDAGHKESDFR